MYISTVRIENFRNFRSVEIPLQRKTILMGENNSGKTNLMRALTLPLASSELGLFRKTLEWDDINKECKEEFFDFVRYRKDDILAGKMTVAELSEHLPCIRVKLSFKPDEDTDDVYYLKKLLSSLTSDSESYTICYRFFIKDVRKLLERLIAVLRSNDFNQSTKHSLLPIENFVSEITTVSEEDSIGFSELQHFRYALIPAERDEFSSNIRNIGSKLFVRLLSSKLTPEKNSSIENAYNVFFDNIRKTATVNELINWQNNPMLENAKNFFSDLELQPNMPNLYSILNSARLGLKEGPLSEEGLGHRNLLFLCVLLNAVATPNENDPRFSLLLIDEADAHLSQSSQLIFNSFLNSKVVSSNRNLQVVFDTHSLNFLQKENLANIVIVSDGEAYGLSEFFEPDELNYLSRNPNLDIYNYLFAKRVILVEGPSEELLIRAHRSACRDEINQTTIISFHKGFKNIIKTWKKIHTTSESKLAIIRDGDDEPKAQEAHESLDCNNVHSFTTNSYTLESEIVEQGKNFELLINLFFEKLGWEAFASKEELIAKWKENKLTAGLVLCQEYGMGNLPEFELPQHINNALQWLGD